ncbi:unnamed protein product [Dibothriocephalus latus]|uniref:Uncharacterized protein n=1 Tax=Dibothriocephalus latus TaxID=60516 RepID=A0A3P7M7X2_DIBLA|nr:unnamed protein product [Dibothriocephalus latus]
MLLELSFGAGSGNVWTSVQVGHISCNLTFLELGYVVVAENVVGLEDAYTASDRLAFEKILYERIREVALAVCQPKVATAEEATSLSRSTNETSSDAELLEYNTLLNSLFSDFEAFLARANCEKPAKAAASATATNVAVANTIPEQAHADSLATLNAHLTDVCPKVRTPCGRVFKVLEPTFRCKCVPSALSLILLLLLSY